MYPLYEAIASYENLRYAYNAACKTRSKSREVYEFACDETSELNKLSHELQTYTWEPLPCRKFTIYEPKRREIKAPNFRDRIVHHAIVQQVLPYFEKRFIYHSYACRVNKGTLKAAQALYSGMQSMNRKAEKPYCVKCDISKYFWNIDHTILIHLIKKVIPDDMVEVLWWKIIKGYAEPNSFVGIPVGALTSQLAANIYLDQLDHFLTDDCAAPKYYRYMDDFIILTYDKEQAKYYLELVKQKVAELRLTINPKTSIFPISRGIDFCGYRIWTTHFRPRKRIIKTFKNKMKKLAQEISIDETAITQVRPIFDSFLGYMQHCAGLEDIEFLYADFPFLSQVHPFSDIQSLFDNTK